MNVKRSALLPLAGIVASTVVPAAVAQQQLSKLGRDSAQTILETVASDIKKHYYDPNFHGLDWDKVVADAKRGIDQSTSFDKALTYVAVAVDALDDSHTVMLPPRTMINADRHGWVTNWWSLMLLRNFRHSYGWEHEIIGERCFVTHVRPETDAEKKGLHVGDEILSINGYHPERATMQRADYVFNVLRPQPELKLDVLDPGGEKRYVTIAAIMQHVPLVSQYQQSGTAIRAYEDREHFLRPRVVDLGDELEVIKLSELYLNVDAVERLIEKARKHRALILDLRNNLGGAEETLQYLLGGIFNHEVKIGDQVTRSDRKPLVAKPLHKIFEGKIAILIDSGSMSGAELFSRVVQIERRGVVIGDRSAGRVMGAKFYQHQLFGAAVFYGVSVTEADIIMKDEKSLEHVGVTPDEVMLPTAVDLAQGRDPVLAHAAEVLGVKLGAEDAGKLFPYEWPPE